MAKGGSEQRGEGKIKRLNFEQGADNNSVDMSNIT